MSKEFETILSFDQMNLKENVLRGIYSSGFEKPSAIQSQAIIPLTQGRDTIAQAQSGTGKTAAFTIGVLQRIDESKPSCQALILAPTRELSNQIFRVITMLSDYTTIKSHVCIGGKSINDDNKSLRQGCQVVVGTPGRILDLMERKMLLPKEIICVVMDEADEMMSIGFSDQIQSILQNMPNDVQIALFSATMSPEMIRLTERFMRNPARIHVNQDEVTLEGIRQYYVDVEKEEWKLPTLLDLYENISISQAIIFCNTRRTVEWLSEQLNEKGFAVSPFHAEMEQHQRDDLMKSFRSGLTRVLVTTDILGRGIDVQQISLVFNYDIPTKKESYIHRIGRSGRFGRKGMAINFITEETSIVLRDIQHYYETEIKELPSDVSQLDMV